MDTRSNRPTNGVGVHSDVDCCGVVSQELARSYPTLSASVGDSHTLSSHPWCDVSRVASVRAACSRLGGRVMRSARLLPVNDQERRDRRRHRCAVPWVRFPVSGGRVTSRSGVAGAPANVVAGNYERGALVTSASIADRAYGHPKRVLQG
jgi:hypothetical protein